MCRPRTPADLEAAGENDALLDAVHQKGVAVAISHGPDLSTAVVWLIAALGVSNPAVRRAAADALARAHRRKDLDASVRALILQQRPRIESPHVDCTTMDSFVRPARGRGLLHSDYPVHTDYGVGGSLD